MSLYRNVIPPPWANTVDEESAREIGEAIERLIDERIAVTALGETPNREVRRTLDDRIAIALTRARLTP